MTTATAPRRRKEAAPARRPGKTTRTTEATGPDLKIVDRRALRRRRRRRALATVSAFLVVVTLFAVALLYAQLVKDQQRIDQLRAEIAETTDEKAQLERAVAKASTPDVIVEKAGHLGMVRAVDPQYLVAVRSPESTVAGP